MTNASPTAHSDHRLQALQRANEVRKARASLRRQIADGTVTVAELLVESPDAVSSWPVAELLMAQRSWGRIKASRFLYRNQISEFKPVGKLTDRQCRLLAAQLRRAASETAS